MSKRSKETGERAKKQRVKTKMVSRSASSKVIGTSSDLKEARAQQAAASDVLRVISNCSNDLQAVFEAMLEKALSVCDVMGGGICRWDGTALHHVAARWVQPDFAELMMHTPIYPNPKTNVGRMLVTKKVVHVPDLATEPAYVERREPGIVAVVEVGRARTALYVPILRENELVGAFLLARGEVRPFTSKQIELVEKLRSPSSSRHRERIPARERRNYSTFLKRTKVKLNGSFAR